MSFFKIDFTSIFKENETKKYNQPTVLMENESQQVTHNKVYFAFMLP